jgi:cystathionine beta-lyase
MEFDFDTVHERRGTDSSKWSRFPSDVIPMPVATHQQ